MCTLADRTNLLDEASEYLEHGISGSQTALIHNQHTCFDFGLLLDTEMT